VLIVACGLAYAAILIGVPKIWIGVGALVMMGIGIAAAASIPSSTGGGDKPTEVHHHHAS
jgi:hypothetical protein